MDERVGLIGGVHDDRWDDSYQPTFLRPPRQMINESGQSTYPLIPPLRDAAKTMDPTAMLARAAQAFIFAAIGAETTMDRSAALSRGRAFADLAVTGRRAYAAFRLGVDRAALRARTRELVVADDTLDPTDVQVDAAIDQALDRAYAVAWALRGPAAQQAARREPLGWIAVSSEDDKAHRPVNVPPPPYDQYEVGVACGGLVLQTRYIVALSKPPKPKPVRLSPKPRDVPRDRKPRIPPDHEVILFLHGHGSGVEEAVEFIPYLLKEGARRRKKYAIVAFDLPSNGYSESVDHTAIAATTATTYPRVPTDSGPIATPVLDFIEDFVVAFVDALETVSPIKNRVAAVIGGSLGGNLALRLGRRDAVNGTDTPWLKNSSIVAWNPASVWKPKVAHTVDYMAPDRCMQRADETEYLGARANYFFQVYEEKQLEGIIQPQPQYWYRGDWAPRAVHIDQSWLGRIDIYDSNYRRWHWRVAGEQLVYSHQDNEVFRDGTTPIRYTQNTVRTLLVTGTEDNYIGTHIYDNTVAIGRAMTTPGHLLRVPAGHSIHFERPGFFARAIVDFLAGQSMEITCTKTQDGRIVEVAGTNHTDGTWFRMSADECMEAILAGDEFFVTDSAGVQARVVITSTTPRPAFGDPGGKNLGYYLRTVADTSDENNLDALPECHDP